MVVKIGFSDWHILREKSFEVAWLILGMFLDVYDLHRVLDSSRCRMSHYRWRDRRSIWPDCHRISWWPMAGPSVKRP